MSGSDRRNVPRNDSDDVSRETSTSLHASRKHDTSHAPHIAPRHPRRRQAQIHRFLSDFSRVKWRIAAKGIISGFAVGLLVVLYRLGIGYGTRFATAMYAWLRDNPLWIAAWAAAAVLAGLFVACLIRWEPMASGSGIPQTEGVVTRGMRMRAWSILVVRYAGGLLCGLFGLSMGREGPSVQIGAATSQATGGRLAHGQVDRNALITSGAAAGLSAAFCAPLSGAMFALEEIHRSFSPTILLTAMSASLTSDFVAKYCFGLRPVLDFAAIQQLPLTHYWWLLPLGLATGVIGVVMNRLLLGLQTLMSHVPAMARPIISLAVALPCGMLLPLTLGGGENLIAFMERGGAGLGMLAALLIVKMLFTATSFASGAPGGIFMPILAVGSITGALVATLGGMPDLPIALDAQYVSVFAVIGMAGTLAAATKAPITSILLIVEMSGNITHMLPVAACVLIALFVADVCNTKPIYEVLLDRYQAGHPDNAGAQPTAVRSGVVEYPVEIGSRMAGSALGNVPLPDGMMIITVRRGSRDFVPNPSSVILAGDYVVVLFSGCSESIARTTLSGLCRG
ncbi:ClC family H(+)/Cl(-) exchange transporter [Bifidobacterium vansinderenii]|uniref:Sodium:proton antiporter n=1 Tax=Bifidobacterium vansinderenii TaxID=1984871 RepID=A0A229VWE6_9BIFI|nr:ClC family H(+)/Cl(-) exchange transporter [Bifidobacterium vansinderenii]OXM99921.1 sodium:proton antiporter [Bifidobacterium vansinderenii]